MTNRKPSARVLNFIESSFSRARNLPRRIDRTVRLGGEMEGLETRRLLSFQVVNTSYDYSSLGEDGTESLRVAIALADESGQPTTIIFDFQNPNFEGTPTIDLASPLPAITVPINMGGAFGTSEPDVQLHGVGPYSGDGLQFTATASGSYIDGMIINNFEYDGITLLDADDVSIQDCLIGTDPSGEVAEPNGGDGIRVDSTAQCTIGGNYSGEGNVISGNRGNGIEIYGTSSIDNNVVGNKIGTDESGNNAIGNSGIGVYVHDTGPGFNTIGSSKPLGGNVISGNGQDGVRISGIGTNGNVIERNNIGTNASGMAKLGNGWWGVEDINAARTVIGGPGVINEISGNDQGGVAVYGSSAVGVEIEGDVIGLAADGNTPLGNAFSGVYVGDFGAGLGDATGTVIGGTSGGDGDDISGNGNYGVWITGPGTSGTVVERDLIGTNASGACALGNAWDGLRIDGGAHNSNIGMNSSEDGNVISGNDNGGINITGGSGGNVLLNNYIGTDSTGEYAVGNGDAGVYIDDCNGNQIGGSAALARNVISGNNTNNYGYDGVDLNGSSDNQIAGNYIGTDASGTKSLSGNRFGVFVFLGSSNNLIGGLTSGAGNLISGNESNGVQFNEASSIGNVVEGNKIGTDLTGTKAIANLDDGIQFFLGSSANTIGGTASGAGNIISGNGGKGVSFFDNSDDNSIQGNFIGTDITGTEALGNGDAGVYIDDSNGNQVGGNDPLARNVISGNNTNNNGYDGVNVNGSSGNLIAGNYIGTDASGTKSLSGNRFGVFVFLGSSDNLIGGVTSGAGNLISGNESSGVQFNDSDSTGNAVEGNKIGTDLSGTKEIGNLGDGIQFFLGASGNTIGGTTSGAGNLISCNQGNGISILGADDNTIQGNFIGTDVTGTQALGNAANGVYLSGG